MLTNERTQAMALANRLLDEPNCDPDDDLRVLSRQLLRCCEEIDKYKAWAASCDEPGCSATWQPMVDGPVIPCTLPAGHTGKHRAPEPFSEQAALETISQDQIDWVMAVVRTASHSSGFSKEKFLRTASLAWDVCEKRAENRGAE